jgi:hypothetical protein
MDSLYQRLKEIDPHTFQILCFHILKERQPGLELRHVDGAAGDEGLDVFAGELESQPTIWQCKSFVRIGESQKDQIRGSLKTALAKFSPRHWILCLSVDMDSKTQRWFEKWKNSHAKRVKIGLFSASDIVHELLHRRTIRNHFFPNAVLDTDELKRIIKRTGELRLDEVETLTESNLEEFVERLKERDARFNYQIVFDGDLGPSAPRYSEQPGIFMSIHKGAKTVNIFARDHEALRSNPVKFRMTFKNSGVEKSERFLRTGYPQEFTAEEIESITSDSPVLAPIVQFHGPHSRIVVGPSPELTRRKRMVRVTFQRLGAESIEYPLMEIGPTRIGTDEAECKCSGDDLPFEIRLTTPPPHKLKADQGSGSIDLTISYRSAIGFEVKQLKKFLDAMALLTPSGGIKILDLKSGSVLIEAEVHIDGDAFGRPAYHEFVNALEKIAIRFGVDLRVPATVTDKEQELIWLLTQYIDESTFVADNISTAMVKSEENRNMMRQALANGKGHFRFAYARVEPKPILFGTTIDTGPCGIEFDADVADLKTTMESFESAAIGDAVQVTFRPTAPLRFRLISDIELNSSVG